MGELCEYDRVVVKVILDRGEGGNVINMAAGE